MGKPVDDFGAPSLLGLTIKNLASDLPVQQYQLGVDCQGRLSTGADDQGWVASWIRLPQVSSSTAVVTGPIAVGGWVKVTPSASSRSYSA